MTNIHRSSQDVCFTWTFSRSVSALFASKAGRHTSTHRSTKSPSERTSRSCNSGEQEQARHAPNSTPKQPHSSDSPSTPRTQLQTSKGESSLPGVLRGFVVVVLAGVAHGVRAPGCNGVAGECKGTARKREITGARALTSCGDAWTVSLVANALAEKYPADDVSTT